jgi:hypothetical protein
MSTPGTREHALEHLVAAIIRKYGDNGSSILLAPETYEGGFTFALSHTPGGVPVELLDRDADELEDMGDVPTAREHSRRPAGLDFGGYQDPRLWARVQAVEYDYVRRVGRLCMAAGCCTDMTGAIELFRHLHPGVERIETYAGGHPDTIYSLGVGRWTATRP